MRDPNQSIFEFVVLASQRAKQLIRGCTPRIESDSTLIRIATNEVATGVVAKLTTDEED